MKNFKLRELKSPDIESEIIKIGFDNSYSKYAVDKFNYKNIKIYDLTPAQANIIKQTALSTGADCATHRDVITGNAERSDVILGGSVSQIKKISEKLLNQPFSLSVLAQNLQNLCQKFDRHTKIVGIVNITPDSFSDGGLYYNPDEAIKHIDNLINDGADMLDIGAESTKPFSHPVDDDEQIRRLEPVIKYLSNIKVPISVDTRSSKVAEYVLENGVSIINDVSGFDYDKRMSDVISKYKTSVIIQHSKGTPENMQNSPEYSDVIEEIYTSLFNKIEFAKEKGIENIIADPGIGFGKTREHNFEILNRIEEFYSLNVPIMVGVSRKSFLGLSGSSNEEKDIFTLAVSYPLIRSSVDYLRVHNVKLHRQLLDLTI